MKPDENRLLSRAAALRVLRGTHAIRPGYSDVLTEAARSGRMAFLKRWLLIKLGIAGLGDEPSWRYIFRNFPRWNWWRPLRVLRLGYWRHLLWLNDGSLFWALVYHCTGKRKHQFRRKQHG